MKERAMYSRIKSVTALAAMWGCLLLPNLTKKLNAYDLPTHQAIAERSRPRYQEGFQIIAPQLPNIDQILPNIALIEFRENEAIYRITRLDDGISISFEVRFVIDGDGLWRVRSF
jgi:hypothetical protein